MLRDSVSGQRPTVLEWYNEVFLKCYEDQNGQVKAFDRGGKMIYEKEISVTVEELVNKTKEVSKNSPLTKVNEIPKTVGYFPEKPENLTESSTPEQSSSSNEGIVENTIEKICPYCNERMKPTEFMDHVIENHPGYSLFPSIDELNLYKMTHGVKKTG